MAVYSAFVYFIPAVILLNGVRVENVSETKGPGCSAGKAGPAVTAGIVGVDLPLWAPWRGRTWCPSVWTRPCVPSASWGVVVSSVHVGNEEGRGVVCTCLQTGSWETEPQAVTWEGCTAPRKPWPGGRGARHTRDRQASSLGRRCVKMREHWFFSTSLF